MSFLFGILLLLSLIALIFSSVRGLTLRKGRSFRKWLVGSFLLPVLPLILFFMPGRSSEKNENGETETARSSFKMILEYAALFLIFILEIYLVWALNHWLSQPWGKGDSELPYDQRLFAAPSKEELESANAFLEAFFRPKMTGEPISMPPFSENKTEEHCITLCGYSGICDQIKLTNCFREYRVHYESVMQYLQENYAYPWTKSMVKFLAQADNREGVLDYGRLSRQLSASQKSYATLLKAYNSDHVDPVLLARALNNPLQKTGVPDFAKSEMLYRQELKFYR